MLRCSKLIILFLSFFRARAKEERQGKSKEERQGQKRRPLRNNRSVVSRLCFDIMLTVSFKLHNELLLAKTDNLCSK